MSGTTGLSRFIDDKCEGMDGYFSDIHMTFIVADAIRRIADTRPTRDGEAVAMLTEAGAQQVNEYLSWPGKYQGGELLKADSPLVKRIAMHVCGGVAFVHACVELSFVTAFVQRHRSMRFGSLAKRQLPTDSEVQQLSLEYEAEFKDWQRECYYGSAERVRAIVELLPAALHDHSDESDESASEGQSP